MKPIYVKYISENKIEKAPVAKDGVVGFCYNKNLCQQEGFDKLLIKEPKNNDIPYYIVEGDCVIQKWKEKDILLVAESNPFLSNKTDEEIKATDVDMLENMFNHKKYTRGYKVYSRWFNDSNFVNGTTVPSVERLYSLVFNNEGVVTGEQVMMRWYKKSGDVAFSKTIIENLSAKDVAKKLKEIREIRILYLQNPESEYINETMRQYIDMLFNHYKQEVLEYILNDSNTFENAILNESNPQILGILGAVLPDGKTVKESILYQIQGGY